MAKPSLVIRFEHGIPTVYLDQPLDLNVVVNDPDDYNQRMADAPCYFLEPKVDAAIASAALRMAEESS